MEGRKSNEVSLVVGSNFQESMTNLLYMYCA